MKYKQREKTVVAVQYTGPTWRIIKKLGCECEVLSKPPKAWKVAIHQHYMTGERKSDLVAKFTDWVIRDYDSTSPYPKLSVMSNERFEKKFSIVREGGNVYHTNEVTVDAWLVVEKREDPDDESFANGGTYLPFKDLESRLGFDFGEQPANGLFFRIGDYIVRSSDGSVKTLSPRHFKNKFVPVEPETNNSILPIVT